MISTLVTRMSPPVRVGSLFYPRPPSHSPVYLAAGRKRGERAGGGAVGTAAALAGVAAGG